MAMADDKSHSFKSQNKKGALGLGESRKIIIISSATLPSSLAPSP